MRANDSDWRQLKRDVRRIYAGTHRDRAAWLARFYLSGAWFDLRYFGDEVWDRYAVGERERDSTGEMGDGPEVTAELLRLADADPRLASAILEAEGAGTLAYWRQYATSVAQCSLF